MPDTHEGERRKGPASNPAAGFVLASLLACWMCSTATTPKSTPPVAKAISLPGFRVPPPPGKGWHGSTEPSIRTVTFWKKWGGLVRWLTDEMRRADIVVASHLVPLDQWSLAGDELTMFLKNEYAMAIGLGVTAAWTSGSVAGREFQYLKREGLIEATEEETDLDTLTEEPRFKQNGLFGLHFPPDLERRHLYFEISVRTTHIDTILPLHEDPARPLFEALVRGLEITGPFVETPGPAGALARAIVAGDSEAAFKAIDEGADVNVALPDWTPLDVAAACDRRDIAGMLVRDERLTGFFDDGTALTPFFLALVAGQPEIAAALLERGIRLEGEAKEGALAPLSMAAVLGYPGVVSRLIARGAGVDVRAMGGRTALMLACESGSLECAQALIEAGAGLDLVAGDGGTAVLTAVDWGRREIMRLLLESDADVTIQDDEGWSPLLVAIYQGDAGLVEELIAAGADVDANVYATGQTALLQALQGDKFEIARILIDSGANVNLRKEGQWTPLMVAVSKDRSDLVVLMIGNGADVNAGSDDQQTALRIAQGKDAAAMADLLVKAGAKK